VFVRPNLFKTGCATVVVYNWDNLDTISVNASSVLPANSAFEVRNVQNLFAPPVLSGTFNGQLLQLPMTNLTVASPNAQLLTPAPTGPTFNVFQLRLIPQPMHIQLLGSTVQVTWNLGAGADALQVSPNANDPGSWTYSNQTPQVLGDQFAVTEPASLKTRFYRLRPKSN
jgi:hypothetical protein